METLHGVHELSARSTCDEKMRTASLICAALQKLPPMSATLPSPYFWTSKPSPAPLESCRDHDISYNHLLVWWKQEV